MAKRDDDLIRWTKDYSIFEMHDVNRPLHRIARPGAYRRLRESMEAHGFLRSKAIHVCRQGNSNKLKVVGGHNRLSVAAELGLPVAYITDDAIDNPHDDERGGSQQWTAKDWIHAYASAGIESYTRLIEFMERHGLTQGSAIALMSGLSAGSASCEMERVQAGKFAIGDMSHARAVVQITDAARDAKIEFATRQSFVAALSAALRVPAFDAGWMIHKIRKFPAHMTVRTTVKDWLDEIEALYNYETKAGRRLNVAFLAAEVMRQRQATFAGKRGLNGGRKAK